MAAAMPFAIMASIGASAAAAGLQVAQGVAANKDAKVAAEAERQAAIDRTDQRLRQVRELRASQRVASAAAGVNPNVGSAAAIGEDVEEQYRAEESADRYQTSLLRSRIKTQGRNARLAGYVGGATSLLQGAGDAAYLWSRRPRSA